MPVEDKLETEETQVTESKTINRAKKILQNRSGLGVLSAISFFESVLPVPILTDPFLVAAILVDRKNALKFVTVATIASVLGGVAAYFIATFFFENLIQFMTPAVYAEFNNLIESTDSSTFVLTLVGAATPIPYTLVAWVVAVLEGSLITFIIASIIGRGLRYSVVGYCVHRFGPLAISYAKRYVGLMSVLIIGLAICYVWLKM